MDILKKIQKEFKELILHFPKLQPPILNKEEGWQIKGMIDLIDKNGVFHGQYSVKITVPFNYPKRIPKMTETAGKIPHELDRHFNDLYDSFCLAPPAQEIIILGSSYKLLDFVNKLVVPHLAIQKYYDKHKKWPEGDYYHGVAGLYQFYSEELKVENPLSLPIAMALLLKSANIIRNEPCFCLSDKKFKNCHQKHFDKFKIVNKEIIAFDRKQISEFSLDLITFQLCQQLINSSSAFKTK